VTNLVNSPTQPTILFLIAGIIFETQTYMSFHQRRSKRLIGYNYDSIGIYFVTICTNNNENTFGRIENKKVILNNFGLIAQDEWIRTPQIRTNVALDAFIIMPDHLHGIIKILPAVGATGSVAHKKSKNARININPIKNEKSISISNKEINLFFQKSIDPDSHKKFRLHTQKLLQTDSLGSIIGQFKSIVTKIIRKMAMEEFRWQRDYYDRIIRSNSELIAIRKYILLNPLNHQK
jgi:putative transposase